MELHRQTPIIPTLIDSPILSVVDSSGGYVATALNNPTDTWSTFALSHTNGTTAWSLTLNGSTHNWTGPANGTNYNWVKFNLATGDQSNVYFDAIVPEPGTMVLLATGLIGLLAYAWRKRK